MKITISPSEDQSIEKHPYYTVAVEHPRDDEFTLDQALEMFHQLLTAFGHDSNNVAKAIQEFKL